MKKFSQEKQTRFSLRKMSIGVCSVAIGLFLASQHQQNIVNAATMQPSKVQVTSQQVKVTPTSPTDSDKRNQDTVNNQVVQSTKQVKDTAKSELTTTSKQVVNSAQTVKTTENTNKVASPTDTNEDVKDNGKTTLQTPTYKNQWVNENGSSYYYDNNGQKIVDQWHDFTTGTFYLGSNGHTVKNEWYTMPNKQKYYFTNDGHTVKNKWFTLPNKQTYYFDNNGQVVRNRWYDFSNGTYYVGNDGHTVKNRWFTLPTGQTYYFANDGHTVRNKWYKLNNHLYYFDNSGHTVKNRWYNFPSGVYYVGSNGHTVKNQWYTMPTGQTYYFDNNGHTVRNRWYALNGVTYYFNEKGIKQNDNLVEQWKKILNGYNGHHVMIAVQSQKTGIIHEYTNSPGYRLLMASTVKVAVLAQLLHNTNGNLSNYQKTLASKMIRNSDNNATTTLVNGYLGGTKGMQAIYSALGMYQTTPGENNHWGLTKTTATDQLKLLNEIFIKPHSSYLNDTSRNSIRSLMGSGASDQNWGISAGSKDFYLKNGWLALTAPWYWYVNSIGYIPRGNDSYTIAVYTDNNLPMEVGVKRIEALARVTKNNNF